MIRRNRHPAGKVSNIVFGVLGILDGLVRACSLGYLHTDLLLNYSKRQARLSHSLQARRNHKISSNKEVK